MKKHLGIEDTLPLLTGSAVSGNREYWAVAALWALRILVRLKGYKHFSGPLASGTETLDEWEQSFDEGTSRVAKRQWERRLGTELTALERSRFPGFGTLGTNLKLLSESLALSNTDCQILAFAVVLYDLDWLAEVANSLGESLDSRAVVRALAEILKLPEQSIQVSLSTGGPLTTSGILRLERGRSSLKDKLSLLESFVNVATVPHRNRAEMLKPFFRYAEASRLSSRDFPHVADEWRLIHDYLASQRTRKSPGVNILIHGSPGTGKTEFVRALTAEAGLSLCEVPSQNAEDDPLPPRDRFGAYLLAQRVLARNQRHALLFDEMEDIFPCNTFLLDFDRTISKGEMNRMLEQNPVPTFWLSNHIDQMDPAYLRRYDVVIEMPKPTRSIRKNMLQNYLAGMQVTDQWIDRMAENENLVPAVIERAAKVVRASSPTDTQTAERQAEQIMRSSLEAMGHTLRLNANSADLIPFRLEYLNADVDLEEIVQGLKRRGQGRLCFYGPPGTGKSAFGRYLAQVLDRPLLQKRASDLLSMWVGESEKSIARMFREAEREGAVLLLDEADSFLRDRTGAQHSWEVTQVNELLTQMEAFNGVFIASTNLMDDLDAASLRRFDFKIHFDYLRRDQRETLFTELLSASGGSCGRIQESLRARLRELDILTPGDFTVAVRQAWLCQVSLAPQMLYSALATECAVKNRGKSRTVGFLAPG